ncbi:ABC transporter [Halosimplex carlsbadense 2-9-1]|uniref:ABC transporter n=1 Tax=Halosimplex carlsbadense 2-9-1 TaxID=797114 RepID=M0CR06_9EURY|nr:AarF/ABC1/UbiB kinase family protein [Halosimplex carlsbadense]ELZ24837.1 ABC transporter [Halosimplex carlsbadense 2-9-1]
MNLRAYWRFVVVTWQFLPLLVAYTRDRNRFLFFGSGRSVSSDTRRERARVLLDTLLTLGPTFIKLGQLLSTRPDVLPPEYIEELEELQDRVPPADWERAREVLEDEVGPIDRAFDEFDTEAISGASLGQVYYATTENGEVAVKVRRPGVKDLIESDLRVISWSLPILMYFIGQARAFSLETLADEFDKTIREEMDYGREAEMLAEIRGNFDDDSRIRIPEVDETRSTSKVLTMEYVPGTKITDIDELDDRHLDRTELAETLQEVYLQMIIEDGVFHADPHPGNLAVQDDGTLVFYDFGMSGYVDPFIQDKIVDFYIAVADQDIQAILDTLVEMGTLSPEADRKVMGDVLELAIADVRGEDIEQYRVQQIVQQVEDTIYDFPFRLPANLALVLRVATVVEGVCVTLDPDFDFIDVATTYLRQQGFLADTAREYVEDRVDEVQEATKSAIRTPPKLEEALDQAINEDLQVEVDIRDSQSLLDRIAKRLIYGMVLASAVFSSAVLVAFGQFVAAAVAVGFTAIVAVLLFLSFRDSSGIGAQPQFTRQNMRQQDRE